MTRQTLLVMDFQVGVVERFATSATADHVVARAHEAIGADRPPAATT